MTPTHEDIRAVERFVLEVHARAEAEIRASWQSGPVRRGVYCRVLESTLAEWRARYQATVVEGIPT